MKSILILLLIAISITACNKDKVSNDKAIGNFMSFDVDSIYADSDSTHAVACEANDTTIDLSCIENGTGNVGLHLDLNIAVGTYQFDSLYAPIMVYVDSPVYPAFLSNSGSVTILEHNVNTHYINGTFHGTAKQEGTGLLRVISNGKFSVYY